MARRRARRGGDGSAPWPVLHGLLWRADAVTVCRCRDGLALGCGLNGFGERRKTPAGAQLLAHRDRNRSHRHRACLRLSLRENWLMSEPPVKFATKIAIVIRNDLETWQKLNVAAFLSSGIAAAFPASIGASYEDASGTHYHALLGEPILIYGADHAALASALDRAIAGHAKAEIDTRELL